MLEYIIIFAVGILVGGINGMAGGASIISYPVLLATGMSPVSAAISNALGVTPANFFALIAVRHQMRAYFQEYRKLIIISIIGSTIGAVALLTVPAGVFEKMVPFLLLFASLSFLIKAKPDRSARHELVEKIGIAASGLYCGYFGPGQGVMVIAVLARDIRRDSKTLNTAKNLIVGWTSLISNIIYIFSGRADWPVVIALLLGASIGGTFGGRWAARMPQGLYRWLILSVGFTASAWLFKKYYLS
ncbi:MAG: sulfite exporter TauE/SafE family protein [Candidatus Planktophila sp.]|nr:sulfite exporter TauE/SafE family protein [Candidatus Planktophila sp.]